MKEMKALRKILARIAMDPRTKITLLAAVAAIVAALGYGDPKYYAFGYGDPRYYGFSLPGNGDVFRIQSGWGNVWQIIH